MGAGRQGSRREDEAAGLLWGEDRSRSTTTGEEWAGRREDEAAGLWGEDRSRNTTGVEWAGRRVDGAAAWWGTGACSCMRAGARLKEGGQEEEVQAGSCMRGGIAAAAGPGIQSRWLPALDAESPSMPAAAGF